MSQILRFYIQLTRLIGLTNLRYDFERHRFDLHHTATIVYCLLLNVAYVVLLPICASQVLHANRDCTSLHLMVSASSVIALTRMISFCMTIFGAWSKRAHFYRVVKTFAYIFVKYRRSIYVAAVQTNGGSLATTTRYLLLIKVGTSFCQLIVFAVYLYGGNNVKMRHNCTILNGSYVLSIMVVGLIELLMTFVDLNTFLALLSSDLLLGVLTAELNAVWRDIKTLRQQKQRDDVQFVAGVRARGWHYMWLQQLAHHVDRINIQQKHIKFLTDEWLRIFERQTLASLFCWFINLSVMFFKLLMLLQDMQRFHLAGFLFYLIITLASLCSVMLLFYVCERNYLRFIEMRYLVYQIWRQAAKVDVKVTTGKNDDHQLTRNLETFLLELQKHSYRIKLCGLFELSLSTGLNMFRSIMIHMLILVQIAITSNEVIISHKH